MSVIWCFHAGAIALSWQEPAFLTCIGYETALLAAILAVVPQDMAVFCIRCQTLPQPSEQVRQLWEWGRTNVGGKGVGRVTRLQTWAILAALMTTYF